jgi:membrane protease YdiL (CAAX protease family)
VSEPHAAVPREPATRWSILGPALAVEGALLAAALVLGWLLDCPPVSALRWSLADLGLGVAAAVPLFAALVVVTHYPIGPMRRLMALVERALVPMFRPSTRFDLLLISVLAGIGEELLFRGVAQAELAEALGSPWLGLLVAAALFGLAHAITASYAVLAGLIGVYLGWLYLASGNLLVPIAAHAAYDFAALLYLVRHNVAENASLRSET